VLLATREIARAKVRFGLLAGAVGLLVFLILFQQSLFGGLVTGFIDQRAANPEAEVVLPSLAAIRPADGVDLDELTDRIDAAVPGAEALTNDEAVSSSPGVQSVNQSFQIILTLAFAVVTLVVAFFFLILTVQKAKPLTLLRAIGAPSGCLVRNLVLQIVAVMAAGIAIGVALLLAVRPVSTGGAIEVELRPGTVVPTLITPTVLALIGGIAAIRRVLRIDPIRATVDTASELA